MSKSDRNYYVDLLIGVAFVIVVISTLVFLMPTSWINWTLATTPTVLGLDFGIWQGLHKWAGLAMIVGVIVHMLFHVKWIGAMTRKVFTKKDRVDQV